MSSIEEGFENTLTFPNFIEEEKWLPDEGSTQDVLDTLVNLLHEGSGEPEFTSTKLLSIEMEEAMWSKTEVRDDVTHARLQCSLTGESFWLPLHTPVPAVAFRYEDERTEEWTEVVHPRLVAAGQEQVMRALVAWIREKILETSAKLEFMLRRLKCLRHQDVLQIEWPVDYPVDYSEESGRGVDQELPQVMSSGSRTGGKPNQNRRAS